MKNEPDIVYVLLGLRKVASPADEPVSVLTQWRIFRAAGASNHFVGVGANGLTRTSTDIVNFDATTLTGVTRSGRFYRLEGPPAVDEDAM